MAVLLAALLMKAAVPAGFMVGVRNDRLIVSVCDGHGDQGKIAIQIPRTADKGTKSGADLNTCGFTSLTFGALAAADITLLATLLAFLFAVGLVAVTSPPTEGRFYLRPPLRGPPSSMPVPSLSF